MHFHDSRIAPSLSSGLLSLGLLAFFVWASFVCYTSCAFIEGNATSYPMGNSFQCEIVCSEQPTPSNWILDLDLDNAFTICSIRSVQCCLDYKPWQITSGSHCSIIEGGTVSHQGSVKGKATPVPAKSALVGCMKV